MKRALLLLLLTSPAWAAEKKKVVFEAAEAFPSLKFENPLFLAAPPDGTNRLFVLEQDGRVRWFENRPDVSSSTLALDISKKVRRVHNEEGLLGLAFPSHFKFTGYVFLQYSASNPRRNVVARFKMNADRTAIDPASETVVMEIEQPYGNHNGGMLAFGPDGMLYIGLGDGGGAGDPHGHAQNLKSLLGKMLRIDVDRRDIGKAYSIPKDNPFFRHHEYREEIWAWGLRNPWRYSFDRATGQLWAGDVGQDAWEEIDIIEKAKNYGWNCREGRHNFKTRASGCEGPFREPVAEHPREEAQSITGGYVYRGKKWPEIVGAYIYGDFMTGKMWALSATAGADDLPLPLAQGEMISSFGEDEYGEIYWTSFNGKIYTLRRVEKSDK